MAKTLELVFELGGKLASSFTGATGKAVEQLGEVAAKTKAISAAAQARQDSKAFKNLYKAAGDTGKAFGHLRTEITGTLLSVAAPAVAAGAAIYGVASTSANYADAAIKNAQSVGMSTSAFTEMAYAAKMAGVSQQDFVSGSAKLSKSVESALGGNQQMIESFARAGISTEELAASLGQPEKLYAKLADTFASMPDGIGKTSLSMALLGKSGSKFIPFLNAGSSAMEQLREDARRLGISLSETDAKNAEAFNDSFANIGEAMRGVSLIIGKNLWPHLTKIHESISGWIAANGQLLNQNLPAWIESMTPVLSELKTEFFATWEEVKAGAIVVNNMVQGMGGWLPLIKRVGQAWLAYRGIRMGKALYDTGASVWNLKKKFVDALPAMGRWVAAKKRAAKSVYAFAKGLAAYGKPVVEFAKRWQGTLGILADAAKDYAGRAANSLIAFGKSAGSTAVAGLKKFATAAWGAMVAVGKFAAAILANPITWIVAGVVALGAAVYLCVKYWDDITAAMSAAWDWIKDVFIAGWNMLPGWIQQPITDAVAAVAGFGDTILRVLGSAWNAVTAFFEQRFTAVASAFDQGLIAGIASILQKFNPVVIFAEGLNELTKYLFDFDIISAATNLMTRFGEGLLAAWDSIKSGIASAVTSWIPGGETLVNMASSGASLISNGVGAVADAASGAYDYAAGLMPFAEGGVVTSPRAALIGEAGPEVVIPVSRPNRARELMDTAAGMMGLGGGAGGSQYTITFSPKISISGGGESVAEQVRQSLFKAEEDFRRMMQRVMHENNRIAMR